MESPLDFDVAGRSRIVDGTDEVTDEPPAVSDPVDARVTHDHRASDHPRISFLPSFSRQCHKPLPTPRFHARRRSHSNPGHPLTETNARGLLLWRRGEEHREPGSRV